MKYKELYEQVCEQLDSLSNAYASQEFYGFFHTSCIYESAPALMSLHRTKCGALKAMIAHQYEAWEKAQEQGSHWTRKEIQKFREEGSHLKWSRKDAFWRKAYIHCASHIAPVVVSE